ncbi:HNH endonuclease [Kribbella sp. VKM Ac-2568]|nr:HNH endonuclease [Kribbella sp. VKM Ac-2568]
MSRRRARAYDRHGGLSRFDEEDDHNQGSLLYEAVVFQDTSRLTDGGWLDRVEAIGRLEARLAGLKAEAVASFDDSVRGVSADLGHRHPEPGDRVAAAGERRWHGGDLRSVSDEIGLALNLHRSAATRRIHSSWELVHNFPATHHALVEGVLTERAAFTIVAELSVLDDLEDVRAAEAAVLDWARNHPLQSIKQLARREAARRNPASTEKAHQQARDERSVRMVSTDFGTAELIHNQDAVDAAAVMTSLSRAAVRLRRDGDTRTMDQLRADVALARLLPRSKKPAASTTDSSADHANPADHHDPADHHCTGRADHHHDPADHHCAGCADHHSAGPTDHRVGPVDHRDGSADQFGDEAGGRELDETAAGADAVVVIHATGAELRAVLTGQVSTGGEVDGQGPIPQGSLRKHLIKAIRDTLLPDLPTTPTGRRRRPAFHQPPHPAGDSVTPEGRHPAAESFSTRDSQSAGDSLSGQDSFSGLGGSRVELRVTDEPPPGDPDLYAPSAAADRYVRWRDRVCQFPGCNRPAEFADLDHRVAFAAGGRTTADNLHCLCRHHHRLKHEGNWSIRHNTDNTYTWISPTGRHYRQYRPAARPSTNLHVAHDPPDETPDGQHAAGEHPAGKHRAGEHPAGEPPA